MNGMQQSSQDLQGEELLKLLVQVCVGGVLEIGHASCGSHT